MIPSEPSWELYRTFLEVMRGGSLSAAARTLGLTQPTVGRHIDALEDSLGLTLFIRTQRGLSPADAALRLLPYAETLAITSAALLRAASSSGDVGGTVRITASEIIAVEVLPPILGQLREDYPALIIELAPSNHLEDLLRQEADVAVRMVRPTQGALIARHVGDVRLGLHAHRDYLDQHGMPTTTSDLDQHTLIGFDRENGFIHGIVERFPWLTRDRFSLRTDSHLATLAALRASVGIGICQVGLARRDPNLVPVLPHALDLRLETWLTLHKDLRTSPCCRVVFSALAQGLSDYLAE